MNNIKSNLVFRQKGLSQILILLIMGVLAVALPITTRMVQQNQENRSKAADTSCTDADGKRYSNGAKSCGILPLKKNNAYTCNNGDWDETVCSNGCTNGVCNKSTTEKALCTDADGKKYSHGDKACGILPITKNNAYTCNNGEWEKTVCSDGCSGGVCIGSSTSSSCSSKGGSCVGSPRNCTEVEGGSVISGTTGCSGDTPTCCKVSNPSSSCSSKGGVCVGNIRTCTDVEGSSVISGTTSCSGSTPVCCKVPNPSCSAKGGSCVGNIRTCTDVEGGSVISGITGCSSSTPVCCKVSNPSPSCSSKGGSCVGSPRNCTEVEGGSVISGTTGCSGDTPTCCKVTDPPKDPSDAECEALKGSCMIFSSAPGSGVSCNQGKGTTRTGLCGGDSRRVCCVPVGATQPTNTPKPNTPTPTITKIINTPTPTSRPTVYYPPTKPQPTSTQPSGSAKVSFKFTFSGIKPGAKCISQNLGNLKIEVGNVSSAKYQGDISAPFTMVEGETDSFGNQVFRVNGVTLNGDFAQVDTRNYVKIKGNYHIKRRMCLNNQSKKVDEKIICNIKLDGTEYIFSEYRLLAGDIAGATSGQQDGAINGIDFSYVKTRLDPTADPQCNREGDLNADGVVNNLDTGLVKDALLQVDDE